MISLFRGLRARPPSPPIIYEWLAHYCPVLMGRPWGALVFAVLAMVAIPTALPLLVLAIASIAQGEMVSSNTSMATVAVCTTAAFWWVWRPLDSLWRWHGPGDGPYDLRRFSLDHLDNPGSVLALKVRWMLANRPALATALAAQLARRRNQELRPADVLWLHTQLEDCLGSRDPDGPMPPPARAQLEQWGLFALVQGKAMEKSVDPAVDLPVAARRF